MARFKDPTTGQIIEVSNPALNPDLISGKVQVDETTPLSTISSEDLKETHDINFKTSEPQPEERASSLEVPKSTPSKSETEFETGRSRLDELNRILAGEPAFRTEQEQTTGFTESQQTLDDLSQRLRDIQRQEQAVPLQIQQEFEGRGVTAGGIRPIEAGRLRENAIEALTVSSLIDAAQNKLTSAQRKVDRAVNAKFGPLIAEKDALLQNLDLIIKSPRATREEKERAEAQKAKQEAEKAKLEEQKQLKTDIFNFANSVASQLANLPNGSILLDKIQKAETIAEAQKIAFDAGVSKEDLTGVDSDYKTLTRILKREPTEQELLDYKIRQSNATTSKAEKRDTEVSQFLESKKGTDGLVSAQTYQESLRKFISNGGTQTNFLASFPQQTYLRQEEIDKLPAGLKSIQVTPVKALTADQQSMINEAKSTWDAAKQTYQATPELRQRIIDRAKQLGFDISPYF